MLINIYPIEMILGAIKITPIHDMLVDSWLEFKILSFSSHYTVRFFKFQHSMLENSVHDF